MKLGLISLGCAKNRIDSELFLGVAKQYNIELTDSLDDADIIVVNTCGFIESAKQEAIDTILEVCDYQNKKIVVMGCLVERYQQSLEESIPEVDFYFPIRDYEKVDDLFKKLTSTNLSYKMDYTKRVITTSKHSAYLRIAEGCDKRCTYCSIPMIRGSFRSVPMEALITEAEYLAGKGVKELILVAQETTLYGKDIYGKKMLPELLKRLCEVKGIEWIRLLYCYPEEITDELIEVIKSEKKICKYIDMPIQHASDAILKKMGRRTNNAELRAIIGRLREAIPEICIRTTLITGFPGESEEDHEILMDFVDEMEFDRLGVFTYSAEEDTAAARMDGQLDEEVKLTRRDEIMELQQEISIDKSSRYVEEILEVIIEGQAADEDALYVGRSYMDAPGVDGYVFIKSEEELMSGDFARVRITKALEYDLIGELI